MAGRLLRAVLFHLHVVGLIIASILGTFLARLELWMANFALATSKTDLVWLNSRWYVQSQVTDNTNAT